MPYLLVRHIVEDYEKWKSLFDEHGATREAGGSRAAQVLRSDENPNEIVILMEWDSLERTREFARSENLREVMHEAGVQGVPDVYFLNEADRRSA